MKIVEDEIIRMNNVIGELKKRNLSFNNKIKQLEADMEFYSDKTYDLEVSLFDQQQRARRNNLEIHGILGAINDNELEKIVIEIINDNKLVGDKLENYEIEACHRLPSKNKNVSKPIIVRFLSRKRRDEIAPKRIVIADLSKYSLISNTKLYINENLSPHFKKLVYFSRKLKSEGLLNRYKIDNSKLKIQLPNEQRWKSINHEEVFFKIFPDYEFDNL